MNGANHNCSSVVVPLIFGNFSIHSIDGKEFANHNHLCFDTKNTNSICDECWGLRREELVRDYKSGLKTGHCPVIWCDHSCSDHYWSWRVTAEPFGWWSHVLWKVGVISVVCFWQITEHLFLCLAKRGVSGLLIGVFDKHWHQLRHNDCEQKRTDRTQGTDCGNGTQFVFRLALSQFVVSRQLTEWALLSTGSALHAIEIRINPKTNWNIILGQMFDWK